MSKTKAKVSKKAPAKKKAKDGSTRGRPEAEIDWDLVKRLCHIQCTGEEIAGMLEIHYDTLRGRVKKEFGENFSQFYAQHSSPGKISLRRLQWKAAQAGNVRMLEWLGKQFLDQKDKKESTGADGGPVEITVTNFEKKALDKGG